MKKLFDFIIGVALIVVVYIYRVEIIDFIHDFFRDNITEVTIGEKNKYYRDYGFHYVENAKNFKPQNKQDLLNIFYTVINAGKPTFTFYCPSDYKNCIDDVKDIANDQDVLSDINNFVHPYNSFKHIETEYTSLGDITIIVKRNYTQESIEAVDKKLDEIEKNVLTKDNLKDNILAAHDYIINHTSYDQNKKNSTDVTKYNSETAYGVLIQGYGVCGGYTDAMQLILEKLNVKSYRVSANNHIWNAVNIDDKWYHIDLTWDDPVIPNGEQVLEHDYFLIDTKKLLEIEPSSHNFNQEVYYELKMS